MSLDMNLVPLFLAVAEERNFRAAADRLGLTRSAVSQAIRKLEDARGIALLTRTTRSVRLTEAGENLRDALTQPWSDIQQALEFSSSDAAPKGRLIRPNGSRGAATPGCYCSWHHRDLSEGAGAPVPRTRCC